MKEDGEGKSVLDERKRQTVFNFITEEKAVTLGMINQRFPWLRWSDLFSIVSGFRREGLISIHQIGSQMAVRMKDCHNNVV